MAVMVGGVLAALTVRTKLVEPVSVPSLTVTVIVEVPLSPAAGVMTTLRLAPLPPPKVMLAFGTKVTFDEVPETVKPVGCVSASPIVKAIGPVGVFSFVDCAAIAVMVGAVLALTVKTKLVEPVSVPSLTVTVIVEVPLSPAAGVMTTLRLAPLPPPKVMLAFGTKVTFDEVPETVKPVGCVSASPIVKAIGPVGVFSFVDCAAIAVMVGAVLALTVKTKLVEPVSVPSLTVTVIVEVPLSPAAGVMTTLRLAPLPPPKVMLAFGTKVTFDEVPETVKPVGCVSASPIVKAIGPVGVFSFVDCAAIAVMVGAVLALTVKTKLVEPVSVPSLTVTVIVEVPLSPAAGVMTRLRLAPLPPPKVMLAFGTNVTFDEVPETVKPVGCVSASPIVKAIGPVGVFSFVDCAAIAVMVGAVLALTVKTKLVEPVSVPSLTVTVMVEVPLSPAAGVMTRLRLAPVPPPKVMLAFGTNVAFDEVPETVNPVGCVSASPMVKAIGEVGVFSFVDCGAIAVMVGAVLAALTVRTKLVEAVSVPSLTVTVIVEVPLWPAAGVMTTLRLAPVPPPKVMLAFGTNVAFDEVPETVNPVGCVSASPMVKAIGE